MIDLNALFSGAGALANTSESVKVTMDNGLATLKSTVAHTSKKGHKCAKIVFSSNLAPTDETQGHVEYVSMSEGARFLRVFSKIVYIAKHSTNEGAKQMFAQLGNPVEYVLSNEQLVINNIPQFEADGTTPIMAPIEFTTNEELNEIKDSYGEDVTFIWAEDDKKTRIAIRFSNPEEYIAKLITVLQGFTGGVFYLETKMDKDRGFQRLVSINEPKL
jgi:hypothetical protein